MSAKILLFDIETFPNLSYTWGKYDQNVVRFKQQTCIATFAAKWLGKPVFAKSLPDYDHYVPGSYDDRDLVLDIHKLFDAADIIVAHHGDAFDIRTCNARFLFHKLSPPSPYKTIDTKKVAKKVARFNSNKLDDLGEYFGLGRKIKTDFDLWQGCINGDLRAWRKMVSYNKKDVVLLEKWYLQLLPYIQNHPNLSLLTLGICPKCGSKRVTRRGTLMTATRQYQRAQCQDCGGWLKYAKSVSSTQITNA